MQENETKPSPGGEAQKETLRSDNTVTRPEKPRLSIWRRIFRFLLVMLIIFGLGALLAILTLYLPQREKLFTAESRIEELSSVSESELDAAKEEIDRLSTIEDEFNDTSAELDQYALENLILKIKYELLSAKLALVTDDPEAAGESLGETAKQLAELKTFVRSSQVKDIENLEARLELVLSEIGDENFAAISDLEVMLDIIQDLEP